MAGSIGKQSKSDLGKYIRGVKKPTMKKHIAERSQQVEWSGIRVMFALADQIPGVINLGIGQPGFDTPKFIREAAKKALDDGYTRYPPAKGFLDLRLAIAEKLWRENKIVADPEDEIFVSVGAMQVIFNTILHLVEPGEEVVVLDPGYDYYSQIKLFGGKPVTVQVHEQNRFKLDPADLRKAITDKTKLIILNSPANPTGAVLDEDVLKEIATIAREHEIFVLSDEPYEHIIFDDQKHVSLASFEGMKELVISAFTLSKSYAMTGWRVGYAVAPKMIIDEMEKLMEHQVSGVTAVAQRAALAAIAGPQDCVREMVQAYKVRRKLIYDGLNAIDGVSCLKPEASFYAFPNITGLGISSWDLARYLVQEHHVAVIPGRIFGQNGEGYLRVSFAADQDQLHEGLQRRKTGIKKLVGSK
ncbi:MAG: pyridoxal phosphate-dependent aminotransferase [Deltaproteobacteria bacterium]|nr:pyridoxal phosphate-dependent aminotransferase [Deltaproteobacteria bacterium]